MSHPNVVALTGGIGSGKSTVADRFQALGVRVIDCDILAHRLSGPRGTAIPHLKKAFGSSYITPQGALDRAKIRALITSQPRHKDTLEAILHPLIRAELHAEIAQVQEAEIYVLAVIPLLFEKEGWNTLSTFSLTVDCDLETQIARVRDRSQWATHEIRSFIDAQMPRTERNARADGIIDNSVTVSLLQLTQKVAQWHNYFTTLFR